MSKLDRFICNVLALLSYITRFHLGYRKHRPDGCIRCACPPALKKPDPFLYSQQYLISLGMPVTWDNPDIYIFEGNTLVDPHDLQADTLYTVVARIWNNSPDVPVINLQTVFSYLSFGAGTQSHPIGETAVDLAAKGLPGCPAFAYMQWTTPTALGHYCLQVLLEPPDDSNWINNLGQRNTDVTQPASPAKSTFRIGNHVADRPRNVTFGVDCYAIPPLAPCGEVALGAQQEIIKTAPPVPAGWSVVISPNALRLAAGEERDITVEITPPSGFQGKLPVNITARDDYGPFGGVTLLVEVA